MMRSNPVDMSSIIGMDLPSVNMKLFDLKRKITYGIDKCNFTMYSNVFERCFICIITATKIRLSFKLN